MKLFGQINIACQPHPSKDVYRKLFEAAKRIRVNFRGSDYALISPISPTKKDVFTGVLAVWTEIDQSADVLRLEDLSEITFGESGVNIPPNLGFNSRLFQFSFNEITHQLFIEMQNEQGKTLSSGAAAKALNSIFEIVADKNKFVDEVNVTVTPRKDALKAVLGIEKIRVIKMRIVRPNPDDSSDKFQRVHDRMKRENLGVVEKKLTRAPGKDTIKLDEQHTDEAEVAVSNGYVETKGLDRNGVRVVRSTKDYPKEIEVDQTESSTITTMLREIASNNE